MHFIPEYKACDRQVALLKSIQQDFDVEHFNKEAY